MNQKAALANVKDLEVYSPSRFMVLDASARRHLELFASLREGSRRGSLIETLDATRTAMGAVCWRRWLGQPLLDVEAIDARLDRVEAFFADGLRRADDARPPARPARRRAHRGSDHGGRSDAARPRGAATRPRGLPGPDRGCRVDDARRRAAALRAAAEAAALLAAALADDPAPAVGEGGVIRAGFSPELDEARDAHGRRAPRPGRARGGGARAHRHPLA